MYAQLFCSIQTYFIYMPLSFKKMYLTAIIKLSLAVFSNHRRRWHKLDAEELRFLLQEWQVTDTFIITSVFHGLRMSIRVLFSKIIFYIIYFGIFYRDVYFILITVLKWIITYTVIIYYNLYNYYNDKVWFQ